MTLRAKTSSPLREEWFYCLAGLGLCVMLGLYLAFPDKVYVFDGIMFSDTIERHVDDWRQHFFNERHLLFIPFFMFLRDFLAFLRVSTPAYPLIQKVNALLGTVGLLLYSKLLRRMGCDRFLAALGAVALGLTAGYWSRATEGQVYMLMVVWALLSALASFKLVDDRTPIAAVGLGISLGIAVLFHAANIVLVPMAAAACYVAWRRGANWRMMIVVLVLSVSAIGIPYSMVFGVKDAASFFSFLTAATDVHDSGKIGSVTGIASYFLNRDSPLAVLPTAAFLATAAYPWTGILPTVVGVLGALAVTAMAAVLWRRSPDARALIALVGLWGGGFVLLDAIWHGWVFFWSIPCAAALAVALMALAELTTRRPDLRRPTLAGVAAITLVLGAWNLCEGIIPQSRLENNVGYQRSLYVRDHTLPSGWVILSGSGFPNAKVYLPYFAQRNREALEFYLDVHPKQQALAEFSRFIAGNAHFGIPLYLLSDMVEDNSVFEMMEKRWHVSKAEIEGCFGPGHLYEVSRQDPTFGIFLFVPKHEAPLLVAVLTYSLITETEAARMHETVSLLKKIANDMPADQRRALPRVMKDSDYGVRPLMDGFVTYMSASEKSRALAAEKIRFFDGLQKVPDFHRQIGNIYAMFGLYGEARREWLVDYQATRDPRVAASLARLPK